MSDQEEQFSQEQEEEEDEENEDDEEDEDDQQQDDDEDQDQDNEDQDQDGDGSEQDEDEQDEQGSQKSEKQSKQQKLPQFKSLQRQEFKFTNLLAEISNLGRSVDSFISTLPSRGGTGTYYRSSYGTTFNEEPKPTIIQQPFESRVRIMKDEDTQVSMQPQIVIQPTIKQEQKKKEPYRISNKSTEFLAQLYEDNKKLRRWQNATNSNTTSYLNSKQKFERKDYEKGIFNIQDRNKQIDEAIQMLKREDED